MSEEDVKMMEKSRDFMEMFSIKECKVGDYVESPLKGLMIVEKVYTDMLPHIRGCKLRRTTFWEKIKFKFWRLIKNE